MTSHVAQFFVDDAAWRAVLGDVHRVLVPGGRLAFDSRDPAAKAWERWNPSDSRRTLSLTGGRSVLVTTEVTRMTRGIVEFRHHYRFSDATSMTAEAALAFRSETEIRSSLIESGFVVDRIYGGWNHEPVGEGDGELLTIATSTRT